MHQKNTGLPGHHGPGPPGSGRWSAGPPPAPAAASDRRGGPGRLPGRRLRRQQLAWFLTPFLLVGIYAVRRGELGPRPALGVVARYTGTAALTWAAINVYFAAQDFPGWLHGLLLPLTQKAILHGQGVMGISYYFTAGSSRLDYYSYGPSCCSSACSPPPSVRPAARPGAHRAALADLLPRHPVPGRLLPDDDPAVARGGRHRARRRARLGLAAPPAAPAAPHGRRARPPCGGARGPLLAVRAGRGRQPAAAADEVHPASRSARRRATGTSPPHGQGRQHHRHQAHPSLRHRFGQGASDWWTAPPAPHPRRHTPPRRSSYRPPGGVPRAPGRPGSSLYLIAVTGTPMTITTARIPLAARCHEPSSQEVPQDCLLGRVEAGDEPLEGGDRVGAPVEDLVHGLGGHLRGILRRAVRPRRPSASRTTSPCRAGG